MTKISLKSAPRRTKVSRAKVRSIMSRVLGPKTKAVVKKTATRKPAYRKAS